MNLHYVGHPMVEGNPPDWASAWGQDEEGVWAAFSISDVTQRMRWIPPGRFMMGSPENEEGRQDGEGPQHQVTIVKGYWLFDTPCTQALWQAVMGENPSYFKSDTRPVEQVSFDDVQTFLERIEALSPGLQLHLPSEAQWEYACRARTTEATFAGNLEILASASAPMLDPISWYLGNSGVGFELENGFDLDLFAAVEERQYPEPMGGTHPVGGKRPNPWGLYDMLGNVWEWCEDTWHESYDGAPTDGSAWLDDEGSRRVLRGGSWSYYAQVLRSASAPRGRAGRTGTAGIGFRCARVQE